MNAVNTMSDLPNDSKSVAAASASTAPTRPYFWSVWRELWENRSIFIAPMIVAVVVLLGFLISAHGMPERRRALLLVDPLKQRSMIAEPYDAAAVVLLFTAFIVSVFYCLDALYGERRDRSILFWKSLPVSDLTTVLSKVTVPLVIIPAVTFITIVATQFLIMLLSSAVLLGSGLAGTTWTRFNLIQQSVILAYSLVVIALWHAPIYGYLLAISAWARRAAFLWAIVPLIAINIFEKITFNTSHFASMLSDRLFGGISRAFAVNLHGKGSIESLTQLTPLRFLNTPGLWIGLAVAGLFLVVAIRSRRYQGPI